MPNYYYTLTKRVSGLDVKIRKDVIQDVDDEDNIEVAIYSSLLENKRESRLFEIFRDFNGDLDDVASVFAYLPEIYIPYFTDVESFKEQLCSPYEIHEMYAISNIIPAPDCFGCLYDLSGQQEHMECPTGCLHNESTCYECR